MFAIERIIHDIKIQSTMFMLINAQRWRVGVKSNLLTAVTCCDRNTRSYSLDTLRGAS